MDASLLIKVLDGWLVVSAAIYLVLLRPWRPKRLVERRAPSVDLLFATGLVAGWAALHAAEPFPRLADLLVHETELPETLRAIDARIDAIESLPERIWADLTDRLGWTSHDEPDVLVIVHDEPGVVTAAVMPAVEGLVDVLLRAFTYWGAVILLATCQVVRLVAGVRRALPRPRPPSLDVAASRALEARVAALEDALAALDDLELELDLELEEPKLALGEPKLAREEPSLALDEPSLALDEPKAVPQTGGYAGSRPTRGDET